MNLKLDIKNNFYISHKINKYIFFYMYYYLNFIEYSLLNIIGSFEFINYFKFVAKK